MKKIEVFVSSSQIELENEREIAGEVVHSIELHPVLFELNSALRALLKTHYFFSVSFYVY